MVLFKLTTISTIVLNGMLIPIYILRSFFSSMEGFYEIFHIISYAGVISLILFMCLVAVRIRSGYKGTRLMIGNRHLHEGTIGIVLVIVGVVWNIWHYFDTSFYFPSGDYATVGWWLAIGGILWIIIGAVLIGRDWEDIKKGKFFNKEDD